MRLVANGPITETPRTRRDVMSGTGESQQAKKENLAIKGQTRWKQKVVIRLGWAVEVVSSLPARR